MKRHPESTPTSWQGPCLDYALIDGVLEVSLHRDPLNEIGLPMLEDLERVAETINAGAFGAHAILIHSSLDKGFSAGADLKELHAGLLALKEGGGLGPWLEQASRLFGGPTAATRALGGALGMVRTPGSSARRLDAGRMARVWGVRAFLDRIHQVMNTFDRAPMPTIAAVHGVCFGGGFELALTCDTIVADKSARFAFPELRLGLIPGFGGIPRLERDIGNALVRDLLLSGRSLGANRAHEIGLVGQLVAPGHAYKAAKRLARQVGRFDPQTARVAKEFIKPFPKERLEQEKDLFCQLLTSDVVERALTKFVKDGSAMPYLP